MCVPAITQNRCVLLANSPQGNDVRQVLLVATITLTGIAALAFLSFLTKTQPLSSFFAPLNLQSSLILTSIGMVATAILCLPSLCASPPPKPKPSTSDPESSTQSQEAQKEILFKLAQQAEQLTGHTEKKLYFNLSSEEFCTSKEGLSLKKRVTLIRLPNGHYHAKTKAILLGEGKDKKAYLEVIPTDNMRSQVRTVETKPRKNFEEQIYKELSKSRYVVHCYHTERTRKGKRVMYLEDCDQKTVAQNKGSLTPPQIKTLFYHYYRGLASLTKKNYLHLDLHVGNLFIKTGKDGSLEGRLGDFGSSRPIEDAKDMTKLLPKEKNFQNFPCCTPLIAPEIGQAIVDYRKGIQTQVTIDGKADVWALGVSFAKSIAPDNASLKALKNAQKPYDPFKNFFPLKGEAEDIEAYLKTLKATYPEEPSSEDALQHLIWELLHPSPEMRPTAQEAAKRIQNL